MNMCRVLFNWVAAASLGFLSGCLSLGSTQQSEVISYVLNSPLIEGSGTGSGQLHLVVEVPAANPSVANDKIIIERQSNKVEFIAGVRWAADLRALVQTTLIESFDHSNLFASVSPDPRYQGETLVLRIRIEKFQAVYGEVEPVPRVIVRFAYQVMDMTRRDMLVSGLAVAEERAKSDRVHDMVGAFDTAYATAFSSLLKEMRRVLQTDS